MFLQRPCVTSLRLSGLLWAINILSWITLPTNTKRLKLHYGWKCSSPDQMSEVIIQNISCNGKYSAFQHDNTQSPSNAAKTSMDHAMTTDVCNVNCNCTNCITWGFSIYEIIFVISHPIWQEKPGWGSKTLRNAYSLAYQNINKWRLGLLTVCHTSTTVSSLIG